MEVFHTSRVLQAKLAYHGGTSSMKEHMKQKHPAEDPLKESERPECKQAKLYIFMKNCVRSPEQSAVISDSITQVPGNNQGTTSHQLSQQERFSAADCLPRTWIPSSFRHQFHSSG